jgi:pimeloyl-ACP methyl ester carboxylesterase
MLTHITLNGTRVQYKVTGEGAPVILLHGWGCNIATMASIEAILTPHF